MSWACEKTHDSYIIPHELVIFDACWLPVAMVKVLDPMAHDRRPMGLSSISMGVQDILMIYLVIIMRWETKAQPQSPLNGCYSND